MTRSHRLELVGVQRPRVEWIPRAASSAGQETIDLAATAGLVLDPWQEYVLRGALGEKPDGRWQCFEVGLDVPRQNGKGAILEARELAGMFLFDEKLVIHSAHRAKTSAGHFRRFKALIENTPDLRRRCKKPREANGQESIELLPRWGGNRIEFHTRTGAGGRGLSGDLVVLDEAFEIPEASLSALMYLLSARPNPQLWLTSSAVDQMEHAHGVVFARLRARGIAGGDPDMSWFEWSVDPEIYAKDPMGVAADPEQWAIANPGAGIRIGFDHIAKEHKSAGPLSKGFAVERLGIGDWPELTTGDDAKIPARVWDVLEDRESEPEDPVAFSFDVTPDREYAAIGAAGVRADGKKHLEVLMHEPGTRWVVPELVKLTRGNRPCVIVVDGRSPAASLLPELAEAGIVEAPGDQDPDGDQLVKIVTLQQMAAACGALYDAAMSDGLRHLGQAWLNGALRQSKERDVGDGAWAWARKAGGNIAPLVAVTLAAYGHSRWGHVRGTEVLEGDLMA